MFGPKCKIYVFEMNIINYSLPQLIKNVYAIQIHKSYICTVHWLLHIMKPGHSLNTGFWLFPLELPSGSLFWSTEQSETSYRLSHQSQ